MLWKTAMDESHTHTHDEDNKGYDLMFGGLQHCHIMYIQKSSTSAT